MRIVKYFQALYRSYQERRYDAAHARAHFELTARLAECLGQMVYDREPHIDRPYRRYCYPDNPRLSARYVANQIIQDFGPFIALNIAKLPDREWGILVNKQIDACCETCYYMEHEREHSC